MSSTDHYPPPTWASEELKACRGAECPHEGRPLPPICFPRSNSGRMNYCFQCFAARIRTGQARRLPAAVELDLKAAPPPPIQRQKAHKPKAASHLKAWPKRAVLMGESGAAIDWTLPAKACPASPDQYGYHHTVLVEERADGSEEWACKWCPYTRIQAKSNVAPYDVEEENV